VERLREMSNSLSSRPKELALNRKSRICIISEKEDNLEHIFLEISVPFGFHPGISRIFGWMVSFSEIQQFPDFLELSPGNFRTICPRFENFGVFGRKLLWVSRRFELSRVQVTKGKISVNVWQKSRENWFWFEQAQFDLVRVRVIGSWLYLYSSF